MRFLKTVLASMLGALIAFGVLFTIMFLFLMVLAASADRAPSVRQGSVLVMEFTGSIPEIAPDDALLGALGGSPAADLAEIKEALRKAAADRRIAALWIKPHDLSTSWATLQEIRSAIVAFRKSGKPIIASGDEYTMSEPDYYLASAAQQIYAAPEALFELNGFFLNVEFYKSLIDRLHVEPQIVRAGRFKSAVEPFLRQDLSPENQLQLSALVGAISREFETAVSQSRKMTPARVAELSSQQALVTAEDAAKAGLLDGLKYENEVELILKQRLKKKQDDDLERISLSDYIQVPASQAGIKTGHDGDIAVMYAVGTIMSGSSEENPLPVVGGQVLGSKTFVSDMKKAAESDRVKAIVVRVNSPGGSAPAADAMWQAIREARKKKPVVISMGDVAASGGYWIVTATDMVVADPLTITGSIGVYSMLMDVSGLFEDKLGITFDAVRTNPHADMLSGLRPLDATERQLMERSIDGTYQAFLRKVATARKMTPARVDSLGQGRVWIGADARRHGLVDTLGTLETAISIAARRANLKPDNYQIRIYPRQRTTLERLTGAAETRIAQTWLRLTTSPAERTWIESVNQFRALSKEHGTVQARMPFSIDVR